MTYIVSVLTSISKHSLKHSNSKTTALAIESIKYSWNSLKIKMIKNKDDKKERRDLLKSYWSYHKSILNVHFSGSCRVLDYGEQTFTIDQLLLYIKFYNTNQCKITRI